VNPLPFRGDVVSGHSMSESHDRLPRVPAFAEELGCATAAHYDSRVGGTWSDSQASEWLLPTNFQLIGCEESAGESITTEGWSAGDFISFSFIKFSEKKGAEDFQLCPKAGTGWRRALNRHASSAVENLRIMAQHTEHRSQKHEGHMIYEHEGHTINYESEFLEEAAKV